MVLDKERPRLFGNERPHQWVEVKISGLNVSASARADAAGRWEVDLGPQEAGGPHTIDIVASQRVALTDVLVGRVYLFTGSSNMHHPLRDIAWDRRWGDDEQRWRAMAQEEMLRGPNPHVRAFVAAKRGWATPLSSHAEYERWQVAHPGAQNLGALPYLFASRLQPRDNAPVGIVQVVAGGTASHEWLPDHKVSGRQFFNAMLAPLRGYGLTAVLVHQGESESDHHTHNDVYRRDFEHWIKHLRLGADDAKLPIILIGTAGFGPRQVVPVETDEGLHCFDFFLQREVQADIARHDSQVALVVTSDIGDTRTIHYPNKWDVTKRAIEAHRKMVHHGVYPYLSPLLAHAEFRENDILLSFSEKTQKIRAGAQHGCAGPVRGLPDSDVRGVAISDASHRWRWANVSFEGEKLSIYHPAIKNPVATRYSWARNPVGNLYTLPDGLPVSPWQAHRETWDQKTATAGECSVQRRPRESVVETGGDLCPV